LTGNRKPWVYARTTNFAVIGAGGVQEPPKNSKISQVCLVVYMVIYNSI